MFALFFSPGYVAVLAFLCFVSEKYDLLTTKMESCAIVLTREWHWHRETQWNWLFAGVFSLHLHVRKPIRRRELCLVGPIRI